MKAAATLHCVLLPVSATLQGFWHLGPYFNITTTCGVPYFSDYKMHRTIRHLGFRGGK